MANFYSRKGLDGFANWYEIQAREEQDHAMLMYQYLHNNGENVTLEAIAKPDKTFETLMDPLKAGLEHERYVTSLINNIYEAAQEAKDFRTVADALILAGNDPGTGGCRQTDFIYSINK